MRLSRARCNRSVCFLIVLALFGLPRVSPADPAPRPPLVFAAGRLQGNYYALAAAMETVMANRGIRVDVRVTDGSYDNADLLRDGQADVALIQSDVAYLEYYNQRPFLALSSVYTEPVHILAYRGLDLTSISDLGLSNSSFVVAVGPPGSGTNAHALAVLDEIGLPADRVTIVQESIGEATTGLRDRSIDVAFATSAVPAREILDLTEDRIVSLLRIDRDIARRLRRRNPFFVAAEIPYRAYGASRRNVPTLGTRTLLVARPDLEDRRIASILDALHAVAESSNDRHLPFLQEFASTLDVRELSIPAHPAAIGYSADRGLWFQKVAKLLRRNVFLIVVAGVLILALARLSRFAYFVHQFVLGRVILSLAAVWLLGSAAMYFFEGSKNSAFRSFSSSSIAILHYLFSGLEAKYPITPGGNVVAVLVLSLGVGVVTLFTATLVTLLVEQALNIKTLRSKPWPFLRLSGHVVIAGWSERTKRVIRQLRSPDLRMRPAVVVISSDASTTQVEDRRSFRGVWVVEGDRARADTLKKADIESAAHTIVLDSNPLNRALDLSSVCCALAVERLAPDVHTIVEACESTEIEHFRRSQVDEVVDTGMLAERLMSQCVITPGLTHVFEELLSFGHDSQEIYLVPVPRSLNGLSLEEIRRIWSPCEVMLLGVWALGEPRPHLNPEKASWGRRVQFEPGGGDRLVVLADSVQAFTSLRARFKQWRYSMNEREGTSEPGIDPATTNHPSGVGPSSAPRAHRVGICGWNDEARAVIRQLQETVIATHQEFDVTVISDGTTEDAQPACTRNVRFVFGDPTRSTTLNNAGIEKLETLVITADRSNSETACASDHRSLVTCLAAREINPDLHLVVEVLQSENQEHFHRMKGVEIVSVNDLAEKLLAQSVISPGITRVFMELLTATADSNEVYIVPVPSSWVGLPFAEIADRIRAADRPTIALGYRTTGPDGYPVVVLNPKHDRQACHDVEDWQGHELRPEEGLVVMAYEEPSW